MSRFKQEIALKSDVNRSEQDQAVRILQRLYLSMDEIEEALNRQRDDVCKLGELDAYVSMNGKEHSELQVRFDALFKEAGSLKKEFRHYSMLLKRHEKFTPYEELTSNELVRLAHLDAELVKVTQHIQGVANLISTEMTDIQSQASNRLWDYEIDTQLDFVMREDDPGFRDDSDNFVASVDCMPSTKSKVTNKNDIIDVDWPDGSENFPTPHCDLFHHLYRYGRPGMKRVDFREVSRIGAVWIDVAVRHQFYYDFVQGSWVKGWQDVGGVRHPLYVQESLD